MSRLGACVRAEKVLNRKTVNLCKFLLYTLPARNFKKMKGYEECITVNVRDYITPENVSDEFKAVFKKMLVKAINHYVNKGYFVTVERNSDLFSKFYICFSA